MNNQDLQGLPESVVEAIERAASASADARGVRAVDELRSALGTLVELECPRHDFFLYHGYVIVTGLTLWLAEEEVVSETLRPLGLTSAPEFLARREVSEGWSVVVLHYGACETGQLVPAERVRGPFSEAAKARLLEDMRALSAHGMLHAFAHRDYDAWMVASDSGMIVLGDWAQGLKPCSPSEATKARERTGKLLDRKS